MPRRFTILIIFLLFYSYGIFGQTKNNQETHTYQIYKTSEEIRIDGELNEQVWQNTGTVGQFWYSFPVDDRAVEEEYQTEVRLTYDDKQIYIAAICHGNGPFVIPSLKRENNQFWNGDVFSVVFDAINERTNAAGFATRLEPILELVAAVVEAEALIPLGTTNGRPIPNNIPIVG